MKRLAMKRIFLLNLILAFQEVGNCFVECEKGTPEILLHFFIVEFLVLQHLGFCCKKVFVIGDSFNRQSHGSISKNP